MRVVGGGGYCLAQRRKTGGTRMLRKEGGFLTPRISPTFIITPTRNIIKTMIHVPLVIDVCLETAMEIETPAHPKHPHRDQQDPPGHARQGVCGFRI